MLLKIVQRFFGTITEIEKFAVAGIFDNFLGFVVVEFKNKSAFRFGSISFDVGCLS